MTDEETKRFNQLLMNIAKHESKRFVKVGESEQIMMIPLAEVLGEFRKFTDFIKGVKKISR